ncbi:MAG: hypothetical protein ACR2NP_13390 [Pirellulaceae bacterium]
MKTPFLFFCGLVMTIAMSCASSASGDVVTTFFAANNGQAGNMFNINVLEPGGVTIQAFDLNLAAGNWNVDLYTLDGSYIGNETTPAAWTLVDSVTGLPGAGIDIPTFWDVTDFSVDFGGQAFYVNVTNGTGLRYTNGTGEGNLVADDGVIQIFEGTGNIANFGTQFRPRVWNGSIHYSVPEPQVFLLFVSIACLVGGCSRRRKSSLSV